MVERNLAKVEVESSRLFSRSSFQLMSAKVGTICGNSSVGRAIPCQGIGREFEPLFPLQFVEMGSFASHFYRVWRDSKSVMPRIANPVRAVRLRLAPPVTLFSIKPRNFY